MILVAVKVLDAGASEALLAEKGEAEVGQRYAAKVEVKVAGFAEATGPTLMAPVRAAVASAAVAATREEASEVAVDLHKPADPLSFSLLAVLQHCSHESRS